MTHRLTKRYYSLISWLKERLGNKCNNCGATEYLHINHINGRDYEVDKLSSHMRAMKYIQEYLEGVKLNLLCRKCNGWYRPKNLNFKKRKS